MKPGVFGKSAGVVRFIEEWKRRAAAELLKRAPSENRFLLLVPVVGVLTGGAAVGIAHLMAWFQTHIFWWRAPDLLTAAMYAPWYFKLVVLGAGGLVVGLIGRAFRVETRGAGTAAMVQAVALRGGYISLRETLPRVAAGVVTIACGGSLGREGPMTQLGGALGSFLGRYFRLSTQQVRILLCAAAGSAIAAVYNAPIAGSLFALEILMGNFALEVFGPVVVASVLSTLVFRSAMGNLPRFVVPQYELVSGWELLGYLGLGVAAGLVSMVFIKSLFWTEDTLERLRVPRWARPVVGFVLVGVIGIFYPHVFGNGYEATNLALHEQVPVTLLLMLPLAKLVATALTFGAGGAGGLFMPSLMVGGLLGGAYGWGLHRLFPETTAGSGAYALVGMGAIVAGTTQAPLTAIMMIYEQTNSYMIVLPLMFACIISNLTVRFFRVQAVHIETLRRRGVTLPRGVEATVMQNLRVRDLMHDDVESVPPTEPFPQLVERCLRTHHNNVYVTDADGRFLGAVSLLAIRAHLHQGENLQSIVAYDLMDDRFEFVTPNQKLAETMEKFWRQNSERLPVLADAESRKLVGWISKRDLIGLYSQEILNKSQLLAQFKVTDDEGEHHVYVSLPEGFQVRTLVLPAVWDGVALGQLMPRSNYGVHVLQVSRREPGSGREVVELPGPQTVLRAEDRLVVIGKAEGIAAFEQALKQRSTASA